MTKKQINNLEALLALAIVEEEKHEAYANSQGWKNIERKHAETRTNLETAWREVILNIFETE